MPRRIAILVAVAIVVSGCSAQTSITSGPATAPIVTTATPSASPMSSGPLVSPSMAPTPSIAVTALPEGGQTVFPGTYSAHFEPPLTLTVGSEVDLSCVPGYRCRGDVDVNLPGWLGFEFGNAPAFELNVFRLDKVFDPKHAGKLTDPPPDLAMWIAALPGLTVVSPPVPVKVGGLDAVQLDVRGTSKGVLFGPIPGVVEFHGFGVSPDSQARLIVVAVDGHDVVMFIDAAKESVAHFKDATDTLQPLVDSIVWH